MTGVKSFQRGNPQFFHTPATKEALIDLAQHNEVVLYCGAGVTIDRTSLGWKELISLSLRPIGVDGQPYITPAELEKVAAAVEHPQRLASILRHHCRERFPIVDEEEGFIAGQLRQALYQGNAWQGGRLVDTIARYAVSLVRAGKKVTIVTTNYDNYIEQAIESEMGRLKDQSEQRPGLQVGAGGRSKVRAIKPSDPALGSIQLIYLHGRIPPKAAATGPIILDELDYARSRGKTVEQLTSLFDRENVATIIVGASLTDPPLIETLALTNRRTARYIIIPVASAGVSSHSNDDVPRLIEHMRGRFEMLGLHWLVPDFVVQIGQFFEELMVCLGLVDPTQYFSVSYGKRLVKWWSDWVAQSEDAGYVSETFEKLRAYASELRVRWSLPDVQEEDTELLKLEIWARWNPERLRSLALWGSSMGVLVERSLLRKAQLVLHSGQASARCFTEGRPRHVDLDEVQPPTSADRTNPYPSRWKSFLSVPVYLEHSDRRLIAGVITLASSVTKAESAVPRNKIKAMKELITEMTALGAELLDSSNA